MTVYKPCFTRPIEIIDNITHKRVIFNESGVGDTNVDINPGTYANIGALLMAIEYAANTALAPVTCVCYLTEDTTLKAPVVNIAPSAARKVTPGTTLRNILGDPDATMADDWLTLQTAPYQPSYCWFPRWQNATQDFWAPKLSEYAAVTKTKSGRLVGNKTAN